MMRIFIDLVASAIQNYIGTSSVCLIFPVQEPRFKSFLFCYLQQTVSYFLINYIFWETPLQRIGCGVIIYSSFGLLFFEGSRLKKVACAVLEYIMFLVMDLSLQFLMFPSLMETIMKLPPLDQKVLGRNLATACVFLLYVVFEMIVKRKEGKKKLGVMALAVGFGVVQLEILNVLGQSNPAQMVESRLFITAIFSMIMIGGFLLVKGMFQLILNQQKRQAELEQMALEKQYQYDYYKKAYEQGEQLRDLRHDMRNQLQAVTLLLRSGDEKSRRRAEKMIVGLEEKIGELC